MSHVDETFFTSVGCMDGRSQDVIAKYGRKKFGVKFGDTITEAGLVGLLSGNNLDPELLNSLRKKIGISVEKHNSKGLVVHGHQECAGNPVADEKHKEDILKAADILRGFVPEDIEVKPVFILRSGSTWKVQEL